MAYHLVIIYLKPTQTSISRYFSRTKSHILVLLHAAPNLVIDVVKAWVIHRCSSNEVNHVFSDAKTGGSNMRSLHLTASVMV